MSELRQVNEAVAELRSIYEKNDGEFKSFSSDQKEKVAKIEKFLDENEEKNLKLVKEMEESKAKSDELELKYNELEKQIVGIPSSSEKFSEISSEMKAFNGWVQSRDQRFLDPEDVKFLRTDSNPDGGILAPAELADDIIKKITERSDLRQVARVRTLGAKELEIPSRTDITDAFWVGECGTIPESQSKYGDETIPARKLGVAVKITHEMLQDSRFDMENEIQSDVVEKFLQSEGQAFVSGDGVLRPQGFNTAAAGLAEINSGIANDISTDALLEMTGQIKTGYNPMYAMNRRTIANLRQKKGGDGQYLWVAGNIAAGVPNQFAGFPYISLIDMDDVAANAYPVVFADFRQLYTIVDRMDLTVIRDDVTLATKGKVQFTFMRRVGGKVVLPEAGVRLKVAV